MLKDLESEIRTRLRPVYHHLTLPFSSTLTFCKFEILLFTFWSFLSNSGKSFERNIFDEFAEPILVDKLNTYSVLQFNLISLEINAVDLIFDEFFEIVKLIIEGKMYVYFLFHISIF